jgi:hypothetical protein
LRETKVILTRSDVCKGHPEYYQDLAARLAKEAEEATGEPVLYIDQVGGGVAGGGVWDWAPGSVIGSSD